MKIVEVYLMSQTKLLCMQSGIDWIRSMICAQHGSWGLSWCSGLSKGVDTFTILTTITGLVLLIIGGTVLASC